MDLEIKSILLFMGISKKKEKSCEIMKNKKQNFFFWSTAKRVDFGKAENPALMLLCVYVDVRKQARSVRN